ncbi:MAG: hypothetical protein ABI343_18915 [Burkholderiaceae bacterium]
MHGPPVVDYPVGPSLFHARVLLVLLAFVLVVDAAWLAQPGPAGWPQAMAVAASLIALVAAFLAWRRSPSGNLQWNGESWSWQVGSKCLKGTAKVRLDLQFCVLVDFAPTGAGRQWLWLEQAQMPSRWHALRRAIHAPPAPADDERSGTVSGRDADHRGGAP